MFGMCAGVDTNRNFATSGFGRVGASSNGCSQVFAGREPFSEPESQAVREAITRIGSSLISYVCVHAYSQLWMYPYGYTNRAAQDESDLVSKNYIF